MKKYKLCFFLFLNLFAPGDGFAQNFSHTFLLNKVDKEGWYKLELTPQMRSVAKADLADLRLFYVGNPKQEIPYVLQKQAQTQPQAEFVSLNWEYNHDPAVREYIIRPDSAVSQQFLLKLSNHRDAKTYCLEGSNNKQEWYGIIDRAKLFPVNNQNGTSYWCTIEYPKVNYAYIRLRFIDSSESKVQVLDIGNFMQIGTVQARSNVLNNIKMETIQQPAQKTTLIKFFSKDKQAVNSIIFRVADPTFYDRGLRLYTKPLYANNKKNLPPIYQQDFELKTGGLNTIYLGDFWLKDTLYLEINNQDNSPLKFKEILFLQEPIYVATYLKAGGQIALCLGDSTLSIPQYDIKNFSREIDLEKATALNVLEAKLLRPENTVTMKKENIWESKAFLWLCILIGGLVLAYFSFTLLSEKNRA